MAEIPFVKFGPLVRRLEKKFKQTNLFKMTVQPLTWGFVQAGLDVQTSAVCIAVLWFHLTAPFRNYLILTKRTHCYIFCR